MKKRFPVCILSTCVVPWDERGEFVESLFVDEVRAMAQGTPHLYIFGTAGEGFAVTEAQFDRITRVFADTMRSLGNEPMVGIVSLSLGTMLDRIERARGMGVRQFQVALPSWGALTEREVFEFFRQVCGHFRDCQFLHYNLMRTKRLVTPEEYGRLAAEHPNLVATKNSTDSMSRLFGLMTKAPELTHFPDETGYMYASQIGECGLLASLTMNWKTCRTFFEAGQKRDIATMIEMHPEMELLVKELVAAAGPEVHIDSGFDKMLWKLKDPRFPLRLLPPYQGATEEGFQGFARAVREKCPHWTP